VFGGVCCKKHTLFPLFSLLNTTVLNSPSCSRGGGQLHVFYSFCAWLFFRVENFECRRGATWLLSRQARALHLLPILPLSFRMCKRSLRSHAWAPSSGRTRPSLILTPAPTARASSGTRLPGSEAPAAQRANVSSASGGCRGRRVFAVDAFPRRRGLAAARHVAAGRLVRRERLAAEGAGEGPGLCRCGRLWRRFGVWGRAPEAREQVLALPHCRDCNQT
jgi:hypothetical protein